MPDRYSSREIFRILEEEILSLKIAPGESLSENELCERFGVSRSPIRSVLQELRLCDLVSITPYKRTQVTRMNFNIINQIIYQRIAVETFVLGGFRPDPQHPGTGAAPAYPQFHDQTDPERQLYPAGVLRA